MNLGCFVAKFAPRNDTKAEKTIDEIRGCELVAHWAADGDGAAVSELEIGQRLETDFIAVDKRARIVVTAGETATGAAATDETAEAITAEAITAEATTDEPTAE